MPRSKQEYFDLVVSFAGPERKYARAISAILRANAVSVFLDETFKAQIWGKNLVEYLTGIYSKKGRYCLVLISREYSRRVYTNVERRAALDRMVTEKGEYLLPVKTDGSWIDGLPRATSYLDIRTEGVVGICETLMEKIYPEKANEKLAIPTGIEIPRVPAGTIPADLIGKYLIEHCRRARVAMFGALIYDERSAELRKLLREQDYWEALDRASGPHLENLCYERRSQD